MTDQIRPNAAAQAPPWAKVARGRSTVFDGWIAWSLLTVTVALEASPPAYPPEPSS